MKTDDGSVSVTGLLRLVEWFKDGNKVGLRVVVVIVEEEKEIWRLKGKAARTSPETAAPFIHSRGSRINNLSRKILLTCVKASRSHHYAYCNKL